MVLVHVNPQELANLLWNAVAITKVKAGERVLEVVLLEVRGGGLYSYGFAGHSAGRGYVDLGPHQQGEDSVAITRDEAEELQSVLRKMSKSKDASVSVAIGSGGEYDLIVADGDDRIAELNDVDPEGEHSSKWEAIDTWIEQGVASGGTFIGAIAFVATTLKRLADLKPPVALVDLAPAKDGHPVIAKAGPGFWAILGNVSRTLWELEHEPGNLIET